MIIRSKKSPDIEAIADVTIAAFRDLAISQHTEQFIIKALRKPARWPLRWLQRLMGRR